MSMMTAGSGRAKADINMTPMIDVLLVLIILFMVITPITPRGLETALPQAGKSSGRQPIVISVESDGGLEIGGEQVEWNRLPERLAELLRVSPDRVVFVRGEHGIDFQPVALAIDAAKGAGAAQIGLMR